MKETDNVPQQSLDILPPEAIAEKALAATVYLNTLDSNDSPLSIGSGFFVREDLIATNFHVIEGAANSTAKLIDKYTTYEIEGITATDKDNDLALLKVRIDSITPLPIGDSDAVKIGETVYVAGNPEGLEGTFSDGLISGRRDRYTTERFQMTAPISSGSSGGPVLNQRGEVIGVASASFKDGQNLNFAIPANFLISLLAGLQVVKPLIQDNAPISASTYFKNGLEKRKIEDYQGAIDDFTQSIRIDPNDPGAYYFRAASKQDLGQYREAIEDYNIAIRLDPKDSYAYKSRGDTKEELGLYPEAIEDYSTAIRIDPEDVDAYWYRGLVKEELGLYTKAIEDYDIAIRLNPDFSNAYCSRGFTKTKLEQYREAIKDYNLAIRLNRDYTNAYYFRGKAKEKLEQYKEAITDYNTAIRLNPDDALTHYRRGLAKEKLGQYGDAKEDLRTGQWLAVKTGNTGLKAEIDEALREILMLE